MRKIITTLLVCCIQLNLLACPVCERNKAKALQGITHGSGPDGTMDYIIVIAITIIAVLTLFYSVKWLIKPNEKNPDHIKFSILNEQIT